MLAKALFIILVTFYNALDFGISDLLMDTILFPNNIGIQAGYSLYKFFSGKNDDEFQKDWEKEMNQLTRYEIDKLKKLFYYFSKNIEDFDEINYEKELNELSSIFEKEKKEIVNDYILDFISSNTIEKNIEDITRLNILCLGKSQIGKTTLINEILFLLVFACEYAEFAVVLTDASVDSSAVIVSFSSFTAFEDATLVELSRFSASEMLTFSI